MEIVNHYTLASDLVKRWREQYGHTVDSTAVMTALNALPVNPSPKQVNAAFASCKPHRGHTNRVNTDIECSDCKAQIPEGIRFTRECNAEYNDDTVTLCRKCILAALMLIDE